jgi:hypothetical protein
MGRRMLSVLGGGLLLIVGYAMGTQSPVVAHGEQAMQSAHVPKSYGKLVTVIADSIGTGLVFEDHDGVIRFVSITGLKEGELARYDTAPTQGGIPKAYGHLVGAVVNHGTTGLVFEDAEGVIRFVTLTGVTEGELRRD